MHDRALDEHILAIIQTHKIGDQRDLQQILLQKGHSIPQATLSRKLNKLKIVKVDGVYKAIEVVQQPLPLILNMQVSEAGLIVLHTHAGQASGLAYFLDQKYVTPLTASQKKSGVLGTIAGDDTVLVIVERKKMLDQVLQSLQELFPYL